MLTQHTQHAGGLHCRLSPNQVLGHQVLGLTGSACPQTKSRAKPSAGSPRQYWTELSRPRIRTPIVLRVGQYIDSSSTVRSRWVHFRVYLEHPEMYPTAANCYSKSSSTRSFVMAAQKWSDQPGSSKRPSDTKTVFTKTALVCAALPRGTPAG